MNEPDYHATFWHFLDANERYAAETAIARYLADGWQLHGGPIALPGERVLQALVKPAEQPKEFADGWKAGYLRGVRDTEAKRSWTDVIASGEQFGFAGNLSRHIEPEQTTNRTNDEND